MKGWAYFIGWMGVIGGAVLFLAMQHNAAQCSTTIAKIGGLFDQRIAQGCASVIGYLHLSYVIIIFGIVFLVIGFILSALQKGE